ncbi:hypothetical protein ACHAXM_004801 [Skeletonema potamos]|jgi:hypothetical protein
MEGMSIEYSGDRRYYDASVNTDSTNFDAETINYDAETIDFEAPVFSLPAEPPPTAFRDYEEGEGAFEQLNNRRGKWKCAAIALSGLVAACALAVTLSVVFGQNRSSISSAQAEADPPSNNVPSSVGVPTLQPIVMLRSYPPTFRGTDPKVTDGPTVTSSPTTAFLNGTTASPSLASSALEECTINGACSQENSTCAIGNETCCGVTYDSIQCECTFGQWMCIATDACMKPECEGTSPPTPNPSSSAFTQTDSPTITTQTPTTALPSTTKPSFKPTPPFPSAANITSTSSPSNKPSPEPTPLPSKGPTTSQPSSFAVNPTTDQPSSSPTATLTSYNPTTAVPTTSQLAPSQPTGALTNTSQPSSSPTTLMSATTVKPTTQSSNNNNLGKYCVNIKFTSDEYPSDNGFKFLSKETGQVLYEQKTGFMTEPQTSYFSQICDLSAGNYQLVVTDTGKDGLALRGNGSYVVDIDGTVILVGGRFVDLSEISHDIIVGFDATMSETDKAFLDAHNSRRQSFHESQGVSYRPLAWSKELAAGASAWAKEKAKICNVTETESGAFGQNIAYQRLNSPDDAHSPEKIVSWWAPTKTGGELTYSREFTAIMWRAALYVGCAVEVAPIENSNKFCQVTNCRYVRTTNCGTNSVNWLALTLDENSRVCSEVFCPGADANGKIVEGPCHA